MKKLDTFTNHKFISDFEKLALIKELEEDPEIDSVGVGNVFAYRDEKQIRLLTIAKEDIFEI